MNNMQDFLSNPTGNPQAPVAPPVVPPVAPPVAAPQPAGNPNLVNEIKDTLTDIGERLDGFEEQIAEVKQPVADPQEKKTWVNAPPQSWNEFPEMAREQAREVLQETIDAEREVVQQRTAAEKKKQVAIDQEIDQSLESLAVAGKIPAVSNLNDPNDPGKIARREVLGLGIKMGSTNLNAMSELKETLKSAGFGFDAASQKIIRNQTQPFGQNAPVGSSSQAPVQAGGDITHQYIQNTTMDEMIRRFNDE